MPFSNPFKRSTPASTPSQQHHPVISSPVQVFHSSYTGPTYSISSGSASDTISPQSTDSRLGDLSSSSSSSISSSPGYATAYSASSTTSPTILRTHRAKQQTMESSRIAFDTVLPSPNRSPVAKRYSKPTRRMTRTRQSTDDTVRGTSPLKSRSRAQTTLPVPSSATEARHAQSAPRPATRSREGTMQQRPTLHRRASSMDDARTRLAPAKPSDLRPSLGQSGSSGLNSANSGTYERARIVTRPRQSSPFALDESTISSEKQSRSASSAGAVRASSPSHASLPPRQTISPEVRRETTPNPSPSKKLIASPRTSPRKSPRPKYYPFPTPPLPPPPRSESESGVSSSSGYKFSSSSSTPPSVGSAVPSPISPDLFSPALESGPAPPPGLPLKLYVANDGESQNLGTIDASDEVCIFIRGDRVQMAELEVALVCLAEADETVYKVRISRRPSITSSSRATPSLRHKNSNLAPKLLCTPPVSSELLERTSYFSPVKSSLKHSPRTVRKATSGPLPPQQRRLSTTSPTFVKSVWNAPLTSNHTPMLSTPKRVPSPRTASPRHISRDTTAGTAQQVPLAETSLIGAGFTSEYSTVAQAYRAAHTSTDGGGSDTVTPLSTTSFDSSLLYSPERSLRTQASDISLSSRRSPQHRYALYVPPGEGVDSEDDSTAVTRAHAIAGASSDAIRTPMSSASDMTSTAGKTTPEWHDYTSTYDGYASSIRPESSDKQPITKTSPTLSISSLSLPSSPSALLQRRLANKPQSQLQESSFNLGLGVQGIGTQSILGGLSSHSESTVAPLSTCSTSKDDDVKSLSSLRYAGQEGWSATEDEHSSSDADSGPDNDEDGFGNRLDDISIPSDTESTATFGLADYDMKIKVRSGSGGNTSGSGSGDGSGEIDAMSISMPKTP